MSDDMKCSACDQLGQTPTPEHLAGVARFDAQVQATEIKHRQNDEYPAFCRCLSRWPCELAADELANENARLRKSIADLIHHNYQRDHVQSEGRWGPRCSQCEQPWPCRLALTDENARLRERVAALEGAGETMLELLTGHTHGVLISPQAVRDALGDWLAARSLAWQEQAGGMD